MKQFIRNFRKQQTVGLLNICSLSLGIMIAIIIGLWSINELSFDKFHKNKDRIYRSILNATLNDAPATLGSMFKPFGEQAKEEIPAIEDRCRIVLGNYEMTIDDVIHRSMPVFITDVNFFSFFTFRLKEGDIDNVLSAPDKVVISETAAKRYFADENPIGKMLKFQNTDFSVSGIMKDMPKNSSINADFVFPFFGRYINADWGYNDEYFTFFLLQNGTDPETLNEPMTQMAYGRFKPYEMIGATFSLESLNDIHFSSHTYDSITHKGNKQLIMVFVLTAIVILIISCINFANLFVSTSFLRAKAIGIRKTVGAKAMQLMRDFYVETACYVVVAIGVGLALATFIMQPFNNFTQSQLALDFASPQLYLFLSALFVFVVLLAGSFPALYMTRFNVVETLSGKFKGKKISFFQKSLIITQFTASVTLLIVVGFMQLQVNHIISYDLGFNKENVMYVRGRGDFEGNSKTNIKALDNEFLTEPSITAITRKGNSLPTDWSNGWGIDRIPAENAMTHIMEMCFVSPNYFDFFGMEIIEGENPFFLESVTENDIIINESAARLLNYHHPVGEMVEVNGGVGDDSNRKTIRGVVRNAYTKSLHQDVDPQVYMKLSESQTGNYIFFKIGGNPQRAISAVEKKWQERVPLHPFEYHFLDDTYNQLYTAEVNSGKVLAFAMLITLVITMAGLFAMVYYATRRRMREIAIRKVYGASIKNIFVLLNRDFLLLVAVSFLIACPLAYYGLYRWLEGFVVKTSLSVWVFLLVGVIAILVTLLTTGFQTWKAATENPVKAIKSE